MATNDRKFFTRTFVFVALRTMRLLQRLRKLHVDSVSWESSETLEFKMWSHLVGLPLTLWLTILVPSPRYASDLRRSPAATLKEVMLRELCRRGTPLTLSEIQMRFRP